MVLVEYDSGGRVLDFGALEIQAVYISGNVRQPFQYYMEDPTSRADMDWSRRTNYPRPDYLSSSRKRLAPQLVYKGGILNAWNKKIGVALDRGLFDTLPDLQRVTPQQAEIAWFIYDLRLDNAGSRYSLVRHRTVYTTFSEALDRITRPEAGNLDAFVSQLQVKLDEKLEEDNPPDTHILEIDL